MHPLEQLCIDVDQSKIVSGHFSETLLAILLKRSGRRCRINRFICAIELRRIASDAVTTGVPRRLVSALQDFARGQPAFLTQNLHQPAGLISPSTSVQAFGSWNREQLLHCWSPFGVV
jgi:hypothetical protein